MVGSPAALDDVVDARREDVEREVVSEGNMGADDVEVRTMVVA